MVSMARPLESGDHPVELVAHLARKYGDALELSFSEYFYRPSNILDERETFNVPILDVDRDWLKMVTTRLRPGWELALNSCLLDARGRTRHIGMIDFIGRPPMDLLRSRLRKFLGIRVAAGMFFFDSGRSLHGYCLDTVGPADWHRFLGRLLLMNEPNDIPVVDTRWIGHRLLGGYSALRWSANSDYHQSMPVFLS